MYDNNGYQDYNNNNGGQNFTPDTNNQYSGYGGYYYYPQNQNQPPKPPKKKKVGGGLIVGLLVGAMIIGGASGFGASYLANGVKSNLPDNPNSDITTPSDSSTEKPEEKPNDEVTRPGDAAPETPINNDLGGLKNMAAMNLTTKYDYEELYKKVNESIVVVSNYTKSDFGSEEYTLSGTGSGVIFTTDGYIITNDHVVRGASKVTVKVEDKYSGEKDAEVEATLMGSDQATDLAVLKITRSQPFTAVPLGDSDALNIGQQVCAIGNPAGLAKTLTGGYISGLKRYTSEKGYVLSSIQTDAAINPGNSGGGLFDMYGNVIGIVNSKIVAADSSIENLGFAITINEAKPIISDLINYGYVKGRPVLGIVTQQAAKDTYGVSGLLVVEIDKDQPVAKSQLKVNDIIVAVEGKDVEEVGDVQDILKNMKAGDEITVKVIRPTKTGTGYFSQTTYKELEFKITLAENH